MQTINLKLTLFISALVCSTFLYAQTNPEVNCDVPSTYFVGEYEIEDNEATTGPTNASSNFESGTYLVTANGTMRSFQIGLLPGFTPSAFTVELNLDCGSIQMTDIDLDLYCSINTLIFASTSDTNSTTYDLSDDSSFIINYIEDPLGSCGGPFESSFRMTKVCSTPENITFSNVTSSTIDMDWIDPNDTLNTDISYTIEYGIPGFSLGSGQTINDISGDNYTIDNLQVDTMYDFFIWTECSDTNSSAVLGPFSHGTFINPVFEVDTNGVTCLCVDANLGYSGTVTINGEQKTFTKRNRSQLEALINNDINDPEIALTCTTAIQDMSYLFQNKTGFNQDISNWDVSSVTDMSYMFNTDFSIDPPYSSFNADIGSWDVSSVTDMSHMFEYAIRFNQSIENWDVSGVVNMSYMFSTAIGFNQNINLWDVSNVTDMSNMFGMYFSAASSFWGTNRSVFNTSLNSWDVSNVVDMNHMFDHAISFNQPLNNWDVSSVTDMSYMFRRTYVFDQQLNNWDVSNVTYMRSMFDRSSNFNQPLNDWDVSSVTSMFDLFTYTIYNHPLDNWDVSNVVRMDNMFYRNEVFNQPLNTWDVSNVAYTTGMFYEAISFNQPLNDWDISSMQTCWGMFYKAFSFNQDLSNWDTSNIFNVRAMFLHATSFNHSIDNWDLSSVAHADDMFKGAISYNQPMNNIQFSNATNMPSMFEGAVSFNQPIDNWDVSLVEEMDAMFKDATSFNQDISNWCVELIPNEPTEFSINSPLQNNFKPNWGESEACTLSLSDNNLVFFKIYPNPVRDKMHIETNALVGDLKITVLDISGKIIYSQNLDTISTEIDLDFLNSGLYFLKISNANNLQIERFIKD
ncbi:BspA family leucine-rich repeat surface protein [Psychroserpens jangbogonensis]|uniref:BspA family leucine-rich repeat surface protein n=1 Tax=Psychroserpens jangbogonensis TaxID=1484460 RepID=UPI00068C6331|nr:BspA family leucine-rich repeat surface protein [Psychroserpens jangbogonensis]